MTTLKNVVFGFVIVPLATSTALAASNIQSMKDNSAYTKESTQIIEPMANISEKRAISRKSMKPTTSKDTDDENNINKMIHYSQTSGTHNPHNSRIFDEMEEAEASVIELNPVRPNPVRPAVIYNQAEAYKEMKRQMP